MNEDFKNRLFDEVKKRGLISEQKTGGKDFVEMVSLLLHSQTQVHTFHLQTKSYSEHKALQGYYVQNQIDTVCELINSTLYKLRFLK